MQIKKWWKTLCLNQSHACRVAAGDAAAATATAVATAAATVEAYNCS